MSLFFVQEENVMEEIRNDDATFFELVRSSSDFVPRAISRGARLTGARFCNGQQATKQNPFMSSATEERGVYISRKTRRCCGVWFR